MAEVRPGSVINDIDHGNGDVDEDSDDDDDDDDSGGDGGASDNKIAF